MKLKKELEGHKKALEEWDHLLTKYNGLHNDLALDDIEWVSLLVLFLAIEIINV